MEGGLARLNFRDLGGLPVTGGLRIRPHVLYRCQGPASLNNDDRQELASLGIRLVCDLRSEVERAQAMHDWGAATALMNLNLPNDFASGTGFALRMLLDDSTVAGAKSAMRASYAAMPAAIRPHLAPIVDAICEGRLPALFHCSAGKDRTGVLVALLMLSIGVARDAVISDYMRSESFGHGLRAKGPLAHAFGTMFGFSVDEQAVTAIVGVDAEYLTAALEAIDAVWGSMDGYFASAGVDDRRRNALRETVTETITVSEG